MKKIVVLFLALSVVFALCACGAKKDLPNFKELYGEWENESWFSVADDGTWMKFDTNPQDLDPDVGETTELYLAYAFGMPVEENLPKVLEDLGFESSVFEQMYKTTARMGTQKVENDIAIVSWIYHPCKGLEVLIEVND